MHMYVKVYEHDILGNAVEWIQGEGAMAQVNLLDKIKINT